MDSNNKNSMDTSMNIEMEPLNEMSLVTLDEYCLMEIFQFLEANDFVNLEKTCTILRDVSARVCAQKFKHVDVEIVLNEFHEYIAKEEFLKILSTIGKYVVDVAIRNVHPLALETIRQNCPNLNGITLFRSDLKQLQLHNFRNLKELTLAGVRIGIDDLRILFASNPDIASLSYQYDDGIMELLEMLPKLKNLHLTWLPANLHMNPHVQHLLNLNELTTLSFSCKENCNEFLRQVATKLNITELKICLRFDGHTFDVIRTFHDLQVLFISTRSYICIPEKIVLPLNLQRIKLFRFGISTAMCIAIVKKLKFLREFTIISGQTVDKRKRSNFKIIRIHLTCR